jgi:hypothetical protein
MDLEHRQGALGPARRQRAVAAGHRGDAREALGQLASQPGCHAAAVGHPGDEDAGSVDAGGRLELVERALDDLHVVGGARDLAAHVPERVRAAGRRIGDEEVLAVGQPAEARVVGEVPARLAGAVQGDDERPRLVGAARGVQEDLAPTVGRVDRQRVVAGRQRRARLVGGVGGVVDGLGPRLPRHQGEEGQTGDEGGGHSPMASGHAGVSGAKTQPRQSRKASMVTGGRTASSPAMRGRCCSDTAMETRAALSPAPASATTA